MYIYRICIMCFTGKRCAVKDGAVDLDLRVEMPVVYKRKIYCSMQVFDAAVKYEYNAAGQRQFQIRACVR